MYNRSADSFLVLSLTTSGFKGWPSYNCSHTLVTGLSKTFPYISSWALSEPTEITYKSSFASRLSRIAFHLHYDNYFYRPYDKKTYLGVGSMKTLLLNISLLNVGDDAYETLLHVRIPKGLYYIRVLELVRKRNISTISPLAFFCFSLAFFNLCLWIVGFL